MRPYSEYQQLANQAIANISLPAEPNQLYEPISYVMSQPGKRLRPVLALMAADALGGDLGQAVKPAIGLEMFHNFTLLHDDVMDNADVRRGQPTVHRRWNKNVAILSGDAMLTLATQLIAQAPGHCRDEVMALFNRTAIEIYEGQQYDMDFEVISEVTEEQYIEMIRLKTSVLLGCALKMGALIANAPADTADALYRTGINLGLAFQLQDDMLDVWGNPETFGKEIGGDIANNKKTFLLINAINRADEDELGDLRRWLTDPYVLRDQKVSAVTDIYNRLGLRQLSLDAISHYNSLALEALDAARLSDDARQAFAALIEQMVNRDK